MTTIVQSLGFPGVGTRLPVMMGVFRFGIPKFHPVPILTMCIVMIVVMIESLGMFLALSEITGKPIAQAELTRGLRANGVGTILGGIFNTFPLYLVLAERRAGGGHRRAVAVRYRHRRHHHADPGPAAEDGRAGRGGAAGGAGWRRAGDVRHGGSNRRADPTSGAAPPTRSSSRSRSPSA
jgi:hypothetical protein